MAPTVETTGGPIDVGSLGTTLMHEHVFVLSPELQETYPGYGGWDEDKWLPIAREKLTALKARGVDTLVDLTVVGTGRNVRRVAAAAEGTGLNVVVATGIYTYDEVPKAFHFVGPGTELGGDDEQMISLFVNDIEQGIEGTSVKAGVLKCATDEQGVTKGVERVLRAVGEAHLRTGVPISTHTHAATERGLEQQAIFAQMGIDLGKVVIGHSGDSSDAEYLTKLCEAGSYIGMDRFGIDVQKPFAERVEIVAEMCRRGFASHMVLSHDAAVFFDWLPMDLLPSVTPNWHYTHISDDVVPALLERGVEQADIDLMLVENPAKFFSGVGPTG